MIFVGQSFVAQDKILMAMKITSLAVFCGSKNGNDSAYINEANILGSIMAEKNITMIYGGGKKGLMGAVADASLAKQGKVIGVIPHVLVEWEHQHDGVTELMITDDMHERKKKMYQLSDAAIILPGGFGTLDELFEMLTWNQLLIHDKPIFILNTNGFYDHLIQHIELLQQQGFLYDAAKEKLFILSKPADIISYLN